jgi:L-lactate dehydrogenase complex protein LldF
MRFWRAQEYADGLTPKTTVFGLSLWAYAVKRPLLYRLMARIAARVLKRRGRGGAIRSLPLMQNWFAVRDFPAPHGKTFQQMWKR